MQNMVNGGITFNTIQGTIGNASESLETQLSSQMSQISGESSPSEDQMVNLQATVQLWSNMIQMQSSIYKVFNDTIKQIVTNAAS